MRWLNLSAMDAALIEGAPFRHLIVADFLNSPAKELVPHLPRHLEPGNHPVLPAQRTGALGDFLEALESPVFREAVEKKFQLDLRGMRREIGIRSWSGPNDGRIHTDHLGKVVTALLYLNPAWEESAGRLRLLRSSHLDDYFQEIPPTWGTLFVFERSDLSYHGYVPYTGQRFVVQLNWLHPHWESASSQTTSADAYDMGTR